MTHFCDWPLRVLWKSLPCRQRIPPLRAAEDCGYPTNCQPRCTRVFSAHRKRPTTGSLPRWSVLFRRTIALADFAARGWHAQNCFIRPDETAVPTIERFLAGEVYDCVVIGAGVRLPRKGLVLFEEVVNVVHRMAPQVAIAFNTRPEDSGEAAARWI